MATLPPDPASQKNNLAARLEIASQDKSPNDWQERLLPLMSRILIFLTIFFFVTTFAQLAYLYWNILQVPDVELGIVGEQMAVPASISANDQMSVRRLEYAANLEAYVITRRYHQAAVSLASNLWLRYLGFVTGMILALVGASFILGKLQESASEITGKLSAVDFSLKTASPGIILAVLGVILMYATIVDVDTLELKDTATYFPNSEVLSLSNLTPTTASIRLPSTPTPYFTPTPVSK